MTRTLERTPLGHVPGAVRSGINSSLWLNLARRPESLVVSLVSRLPRREGRYHVVLPPPCEGNVGDEAMLFAFLQHAPGPIVVIQQNGSPAALPSPLGKTARLEPHRHLTDGLGIGRLSSVIRFCRLLRGAASFSLIGADILDGGYSAREATYRLRTLQIASRMGVQSQCIGFSWGESPARIALGALRLASEKSRLLVRDPASARRLDAAGIPVVVGADLAFSLSGCCDVSDIQSWLDGVSRRGLRLALLNASGLLECKSDQTASYRAVSAYLRSHGFAVLFVPHVSRVADSDINVHERIVAGLRDDFQLAYPRLFSPLQVKNLATRASLVLTGRMHLGILALSVGTPALVISSHGKVTGLMEAVGLPWMELPEGGLASSAIFPILDRLVQDPCTPREQLAASLPGMRARSLRCFDMLNGR